MAKKRTPTIEDYEKYDGMHCNRLWPTLSDEWRCPCCGRTKFELLRWGKRVGSNAVIYGEVGWMAALHKHHNHGYQIRWSDQVLICGSCNNVDGTAKRVLHLPEHWSFSASEISQFVKTPPHGKAVIDYTKAEDIYNNRANQRVDIDDIFQDLIKVRLKKRTGDAPHVIDVLKKGYVYCGESLFSGIKHAVFGVVHDSIRDEFSKFNSKHLTSVKISPVTNEVILRSKGSDIVEDPIGVSISTRSLIEKAGLKFGGVFSI